MKNYNVFGKTLSLGAYNGGKIVLTPAALYTTEEGGGSTATADLKPSEMGLEVVVDFVGETGARKLTSKDVNGNYIAIDDTTRTLTIHLANLNPGASRLEVRCKVGTATKVIYQATLKVKDGASGSAVSPIDSPTVYVVHTSAKSFAGGEKWSIFANIAAMVDELNAADAEKFTVPQNMYVLTTSTADFWVSGVAETSEEYTYTSDEDFMDDIETGGGKVQVGYYQISELEPIAFGFDSVAWEVTYEDDTTETLQVVVAK